MTTPTLLSLTEEDAKCAFEYARAKQVYATALQAYNDARMVFIVHRDTIPPDHDAILRSHTAADVAYHCFIKASRAFAEAHEASYGAAYRLGEYLSQKDA